MAKHSSRPYAYALLGVVFLVFLAWLNPGRFSAVAPGVEAPNFQARDLKGNPVELKDHRGKVVMVNTLYPSIPMVWVKLGVIQHPLN